MRTFLFSVLVFALVAATWPYVATAAEPTAAPLTNRPTVPGVLRLELRERRQNPAGGGELVERVRVGRPRDLPAIFVDDG